MEDQNIELDDINTLEYYEKGVSLYKLIKCQLKNLEQPQYILDPDILISTDDEIREKKASAMEYLHKAIIYSHKSPQPTISVPIGKNRKGEPIRKDILIITKAKEKRGRLYRLFDHHTEAIDDLTVAIESPNDQKNKQKNLVLRGLAYFDLKQYQAAVSDFVDSDVKKLDNYQLSKLQKQKEELYITIKNIKAEEVRANILFQALFPHTFWGEIFYFSRGYQPCSLSSGHLNKILNRLKTISTLKNYIKKERYLQELWLTLALSPNKFLYQQIIEQNPALANQLEMINTVKKESLLAQIAKITDNLLKANILFQALFPDTDWNNMLINCYGSNHRQKLKNKTFASILAELAKINGFKAYILKAPTSTKLLQKLKTGFKQETYTRLATQAPAEILNELDIPKNEDAAAFSEEENDDNKNCAIM